MKTEKKGNTAFTSKYDCDNTLCKHFANTLQTLCKVRLQASMTVITHFVNTLQTLCNTLQTLCKHFATN